MITYPCGDCAERVILPLLPTSHGIPQMCRPGACTSQLASRGCSLDRCIAQTSASKPTEKERVCNSKADSTENPLRHTFRTHLNLSRHQRGRHCVACDVLHGAGGRSASHSGSRSNSNSSPSFSNYRASQNADDTQPQVCTQKSIPCEESANPTNLCPCLTTCQQREKREALCKRLSTTPRCEEASAICRGESYCGLSHVSRYHRRRHCCCRIGRARAPQASAEDPEAKCDKDSTSGTWEKFCCEAPPKETPLSCGMLCNVFGSGSKRETVAEDEKTTLQWALRNVRAEAARTRHVLEGCKSQLLAREEKVKSFVKSPRAARKQVSVRSTPRSCLHSDSTSAPPPPAATAGPRDTAAATPANESQQSQQIQQQKQQEEMASLFQRKFEKEMQAFRRRVTDVTGNLSDKLSQLLERETQLKQTVKELLKERQNSSRLRRIYFEATKKNKQLTTRNTSLERALLDIELKLCRPHNVWKVLGCPAAAALQNELQKTARVSDGSTRASEAPAVYNVVPTRSRVSGAYPRKEVGNTEADMSHHGDKCPDHHATESVNTSFRPPAGMDILDRPWNKSCSSEGRLFKSLPCFLRPSEDSCGSSHEEQKFERKDTRTGLQTQHRKAEKAEKDLPKEGRRTSPHECEGKCKNVQHTAQAASPRGTQRSTPRHRVFEAEERAGTITAAVDAQWTGEVQSRRETGETLRACAEKEAKEPVILTQRLCRTLRQNKRGGAAAPSQKRSPSPAAPNPDLSSACAPRKDGSCSASPRTAPSAKTSISAGSLRMKKSASPCNSNPRTLRREDFPEPTPIACTSSSPLSPPETMNKPSTECCSQHTPRASCTPCSSPPACSPPAAANRSEHKCPQNFAYSADKKNPCCSASSSQYPRSSPFRYMSADMGGKSSPLSGSVVRHSCVDESCCNNRCDGFVSHEHSSSVRRTSTSPPRGYSSLLSSDSDGQRTACECGIPAAGCCDSTVYDLATGTLGRCGRFGQAQTHHLQATSLTAGNETAPHGYLPTTAVDFRAHCPSQEAASRYSSQTAARVPEMSSVAAGAAGHSTNTITELDNSCTLVAPEAPPCSSGAGAVTESQTLLPIAGAAGSMQCQSGDFVIRAPVPPTDGPLLAASATGDISVYPSLQPLYSCRSPKDSFDVDSSNDVACAALSHTSRSSSSSTLPEPAGVDTAVQRVMHSDVSQSAGSSSPHKFVPASFNESRESHNSSSIDGDHLGSNTDSNSSSRCSCCCLRSSSACARQTGSAGCAVRCRIRDAPSSPLTCRRDARRLLTDNEDRESCSCNSQQAQHESRSISSETHKACDSAISGRQRHTTELPSMADEKHQRFVLSGGVNSSCSSVGVDHCTDSVCFSSSSSASASNLSSSVLPFAPVALTSSSSASGFAGCSSRPALTFSACASSSGSSFMRFAEGGPERIMPSCPAPSDTCGRKCRNALDGCVSWRLPHTSAVHAQPDTCL